MVNFYSAGLIKNLRYGAGSRVWAPFANWLVKTLGPEFAAWLTSLSIDRDHKDGPLVLCLSRESFIKDIRELRKRTNFSYSMVMAGFTRFQMAWMPKAMQIQTFYQAYEGPDKDKAQNKSYRYALRLIALAGRERKVQAILSANFDYWQDLGFKMACKTLNIPFVVLSREHPVIPMACDEVTTWYTKSRYRFDGAAIAVAGPSTKAVLERVGTVCRPEQVIITGLPRFDAWLDVNVSKPLNQRPYITLLTFTEGYLADSTFKDVLQTFCEVARANQDKPLRFLVKTKDINDTIAIQALIGNEIAGNLTCNHEIDLFSVLPESRLVINYNSLSLVEAAMARAAIVIPAWGECKDRGNDVMYSVDNKNVAEVVQFAYSSHQLNDIIFLNINGAVCHTKIKSYEKFISDFIYIPQAGNCSIEVASLLNKCMNQQCIL